MRLKNLCVFVVLLLACGDDTSSGLSQDTTTPPDVADTTADVADTSPDVADTDTTDDVADTSPDVADTDTTPDVADTDTGPRVTIVVEGSLDDRAPADGLAAQTPKRYRYGLRRLELLRDPADPSPEVVFDHAPADIEVDMFSRTVVASVPMRDLPAGTFPYFRIVLTRIELTVDALLHGVPFVDQWSAELDISYALSDIDDGTRRANQGDAVVSTTIAGNSFSIPTHWPPVAPNPSPGGNAASVDGEWLVTFPVAPALVPSPSTPVDVTYVVRYYVKDSFRWEDLSQPGYVDGVWDLTVSPAQTFEPVRRLGANAYEVELERPAP